jgi:hypothetical protein
MGTRGWYVELAATQSRGIANAALSWAGQAMAVCLGIVVVVVVVGSVVVVGVVVVVTGRVVVVTDVVVVGTVVVGVVVVVEGTDVVVVVVVVVVGGTHEFGIVVVVVDDRAGSSWAEVGVDVVKMSTEEIATETSEQRRSHWFERRVTQRMYNASRTSPWTKEIVRVGYRHT